MPSPGLESIIVHVIVGCSIAHTFLPPWDFLDQFPTAQKYYKVFIYVIGYVAINGRSTIYKSISQGGKTNGNGDSSVMPPAKP